MIEPGSTNRASRNRRVVALMAWAGLVLTTCFLCDARQGGSLQSTAAEPICFLLASFAAFVGVFAWMLFNPNRRTARESGALFVAATATLFPPPIIGFCLMPADSPLRGWLAFAVFMLCVIAVLSHIPDEFIGVPRGRHTYLIPIPAFDRVRNSALDPDAEWFRFTDLSQIVADAERPSLAPKAYRQRENPRPESRPPVKIRPASDVDDILGTDFELGFLDDSLNDDDVAPERAPRQRYEERRRPEHDQPRPDAAERHRTPRSRPDSSGNTRAGETSKGSAAVLPPFPIPPPPAKTDLEPATVRDDLSSDHPIVPAVATVLPPAEVGAAAINEHTEAQPARREPSRYETVLPQAVASPKVKAAEVETGAAELPSTDEPEIEGPSSTGLQRTQDASGSEVVEGVIRVRFDKGQKRANLHVPFSPPLAGMPDVECECVGDEPLRLKVPVRQAYGIRIEARRANADEALDTEVGFAAVCPPE